MIRASLGVDAKRFREAGCWRDTVFTADFATPGRAGREPKWRSL